MLSGSAVVTQCVSDVITVISAQSSELRVRE
jgi:hypothetical protein